MRSPFLGLTVLILCSNLLSAPQLVSTQHADLDDLFRLTNTTENIKAIPVMVLSGLHERLKSCPPEMATVFEESAKRAWNAEDFLTSVRHIVASKYDKAVVSSFVRSLRTPLVEKVNRCENEMSRRAFPSDFASFVANQQHHPMSKERRVLWTRFDSVLGLTEHTAKVQATVARAELNSIDQFVPIEKRTPEDVKESVLSAFLKRYQSGLREQIVLHAEFTYAALSEAEIEQYISLMSSPGARWWNDAIKEASIQACAEASRRLGVLVGPYVARNSATTVPTH